MGLTENSTAFDVLAILCSLLTKEKERQCAIRWATASEDDIRTILHKYKKILDIILKSSVCEYTFSTEDMLFLNTKLTAIRENQNEDDIYILAIEIEHRIDSYSSWQCRDVVHSLSPMNSNYAETAVSIYPHFMPQWNMDKSERTRNRTLNAKFQNYIVIRDTDASPFKIVMHYWNDEGLLKQTEEGWQLRIALSPVMDNALLETSPDNQGTGNVVIVNGISNEEIVTSRILQTFDLLFCGEYAIIIFPEALGTRELVETIKKRMRSHPEYCTFVILPTICTKGSNTLIVLGPGGIEILQQNKGTPFILVDENNIAYREQLQYDNHIHILITRELGNIAFPICAELLDPQFYQAIKNIAYADTILCPSFSPGYTSFASTFIEGRNAMLLGLWMNTCSAKSSSRSHTVSPFLGLAQLPDAEPSSPLQTFSKSCNGQCSDSTCYFDVTISYENQSFHVEWFHRYCK